MMRHAERFCWGLLLALGLSATTAASAFVFLPMRGGVAARWSVAPMGDGPLLPTVSDLDGNLYVTTAHRLRALSAKNGQELWSYRAPAGQIFAEPPQVGNDTVVAVTCSEGVPAERLVAGLAIRSGPGEITPLWQQQWLDMPARGCYIPPSADPERGDFGYAVVLSGDQLSVLNLRTGAPLLKREVGFLSAEPLWRDRRVWIPVVGNCRVVGLQFGADPQQITEESIAVPGETYLRDLTWDADHGQVIAAGALRTWAIPWRAGDAMNPPTPHPVQVGATPEAVVSAGGWDVVLEPGSLRVRHPDDGKGWQLAPSDGGHFEAPVLVADGQLAVVERGPNGAAGRVRVCQLADGRVAWEQSAKAIADNGWRLIRPADQPTGSPRLALLSDGDLRLLDWSTGEELAQRRLGQFTGVTLWCERSGFIATTDGYRENGGTAAAPALVAFDLDAVGRANDPSAQWLWRIPVGTVVEELLWLPRSESLVVHATDGIHLFN